MKFRTLIAALAASVVASTAIANASEIRIAIASDPDALDPTTSGTLAARQVFASMCDKLIEVDRDMNFVPQLATEWNWSDDLTALTLRLREGVTFHDGEPFDAAAVVYNIERHLTLPGSNRRSEISAIGSVDAVDEFTVKLNLSAPSVPLIAALADRAGMMVSPKAAEDAGEDFAQRPICAGPYAFVERVPQDRIILEKYANYWNADAYSIDRIVFQPVTDATVRLSNLRSGDLDIIERVSPSDLKIIEGADGVRAELATGLGSYYIVVNMAGGDAGQAENPLGQDPRVREALELAIDRNILNQVANEGAFTVGNQPVPPDSPFYISEFPTPERDLERARALLEEAYPGETVSFRMLVPNISDYQRFAEIIQSMAAEAGMEIELVTEEVTTLLSNWSNGNFESLIIRWSGRADPDGNIYTFKTCDGSRNGGKYCNEEVDRWLDESRKLSDQAERYEAFKNAAEHYLADRPYIYLFHPTEMTGLRNTVQGFVAMPDGLFRLSGVTVAE